MTIPKALKEMNLLSTGEAAEEAKVHRSTIHLWIRNGMLPAKSVGPRYMGIERKALRDFLKIYVQDAVPTRGPKAKDPDAAGTPRPKKAARVTRKPRTVSSSSARPTRKKKASGRQKVARR